MKIFRKLFSCLKSHKQNIYKFDISRIVKINRILGNISPEERDNFVDWISAGLQVNVDETIQYQSAEAICQLIYPKYKFSEYGRLFLEDREFIKYYMKFMDVNNWHSLDRKYTLNQLLKLCIHLDGEIAECGTYKGASAFLMCQTFKESGNTIHLFDSFEGLSEPGARDGSYWEKGALKATENEVKNTLSGYSNYCIYKGWIPECFDKVGDIKFSFLHIDVDLYNPTLESLNYFYDRMTKGGIILMDDYGFKSCPGAKLAADGFFYDKPENIIMLPSGQAFVVKQG